MNHALVVQSEDYLLRNSRGVPTSDLTEHLGIDEPRDIEEEVAQWFEYLEATNSLKSYVSTCECWSCSSIRGEFRPWLAARQKAKKNEQP